MSFNVHSLAINPEKPNVIYAGLGEGMGIYRSTDGGEIWQEINNGLIVECPSYLQRVGQVKTGITLSKPKRVVVKDYYSMSWSKITSIAIDPTNTIDRSRKSSSIFLSRCPCEQAQWTMTTRSGY